MTTLKQDVARVRAVAEALSEPPIIWVASYQTKHDEGSVLFASEAGARDCLLEWFDEEKELLGVNKTTQQLMRKRIAKGVIRGFDDSDTRWFSYGPQKVRP